MRIDARGEICPYPMLQAVSGMRRAKPGESVEVEVVSASGEVTLLGGAPTLEEARRRLQRRFLAVGSLAVE